MDLFGILIGRRLANEEGKTRKITAIEGVPYGPGRGSSAYGPEVALTILIPLGAEGLILIRPIMAAILILLALLYFSYRQTIEAYPSNGGSYIVAKDNIGANAGLLAASALMIDYVLNVAVGISAGIGALTSAIPQLHPYTFELCLAVLALITIVNLRGTLEAWRGFFGANLPVCRKPWRRVAVRGSKSARCGRSPRAGRAATAAFRGHPGRDVLAGAALVRERLHGDDGRRGGQQRRCRVSRAEVRHAHGTLTVIVVILGLLLLGIAYLAPIYGVEALDQTNGTYQSVLSRLVSAIYGRGWPISSRSAACCVICLSANTSFVGFPSLCRMVAQDGICRAPSPCQDAAWSIRSASCASRYGRICC